MWEAKPKALWIGGSYQSRPNIAGGMKLNGTLRAALPAGPMLSDSTNNVSVYQDLPDIIRWGVRWKPTPRSEIRLSADWERWSSFQDQCIAHQDKPCEIQENGSPTAATAKGVIESLPRRWQDGFGVRAGGSYWPGEKLEIFGGAGYDSNAVPDEHLEPVISDFKPDHGRRRRAGHRHEELRRRGVQYTNYFCLSRDTTNESVNATKFKGTISAGPDAGGQYTQYIGQIGVNLNFMF